LIIVDLFIEDKPKTIDIVETEVIVDIVSASETRHTLNR